MHNEGKKFVMPGCLSKMVNEAKKSAKPAHLSQEVKPYEKQRQERIRSNELRLESLGLTHMSKALFASKESGKGERSNANRKNKTSNENDPDYLPAIENEEPGEAEVNKVIKWMARRGNLFLNEEALGDSPRTQEKGNIPKGNLFHNEENLGAINAGCKEGLHDLRRKRISGQEITELDAIPGSLETPTVAAQVTRPLKRTRGPTKLNTIATDEASQMEVKFNEFGQPIGYESTKLSSYLGALVREIVPYTLATWKHLSSEMAEVLWRSIQGRFKLDEEWQRDVCFERMHESWRASKSRLVRKIENAPNEAERLTLKPDNIKSVHDWHNFVKEKTSDDFKVISERFKNMKNKQFPQIVSRMGYSRLNQKMKKESKDPKSITRAAVWVRGHKKKNGDLINTKVGQTIDEMDKVEEVTLMSCPTPASLREDALSKVLGPEKRGRVRGFGKGVTLSKLALISQLKRYSTQTLEEQEEIKERMVQSQNKVDRLEKNQCDCQKQANKDGPNTTIVSPSVNMKVQSVNTNINALNKCKLLDWMGTGEVVAEGLWSSSDPTALVHHIPIGPNAMRIWVDIAKKDEVYLWRATSDMTYIDETVGTTVEWSADKVLMESIEGFAS